MNNNMKPWGFELDEYIREGEPDKLARVDAWQTAIGLQAVDGLKPSPYLLQTAKQHIDGEISIEDVQSRIEDYYQKRGERSEIELESEEADIVSSRIAKLLGERTFSFSPATWKSIHGQLFEGLIKNAGSYRTYNITKNEWVLKGNTVLYSSYDSIKDTVDYDFDIEAHFSYEGLSRQEVVRHITQFIAGIWQIHPFPEGNTRATAIFAIKYLNALGYKVNNEPFSEHSWYFRNALVRANYNDLNAGIAADSSFLELFFRNLLLGEGNELKNRFLHLDWEAEQLEGTRSANENVSKCRNCTLDCTLEEFAILKQLKANPQMTQKELAKALGRSERTIKSRTVDLQERGLLSRKNGKRNGSWVVLADLNKGRE